MYARNIEDPTSGEERILTFGVSGKLIRNVLVMYDRETDSYWGQLLGKAIEGPLKNVQLTPLAAAQTTWEEWRNQYPDTKALVTNGQGRYDSYEGYYSSGQTGVLGETLKDDRLAASISIFKIMHTNRACLHISTLRRAVFRNAHYTNTSVLSAPKWTAPKFLAKPIGLLAT